MFYSSKNYKMSQKCFANNMVIPEIPIELSRLYDLESQLNTTHENNEFTSRCLKRYMWCHCEFSCRFKEN